MDQLEKCAKLIKKAKVILIGAGSGLSTSAGFDKKRLFYTQGDYGLFQCSEPCHQKTYDNQKND